MAEAEDESVPSFPETLIALKTGIPAQVQRGFLEGGRSRVPGYGWTTNGLV